MSNAIRFGIMCESLKLKAWEADCIEKTLNTQKTKLALIIRPKQKLLTEKSSFFRQLNDYGGYSKILFFLYERFFLKPKCLSKIDYANKLKDIPSIYCQTNKDNKCYEYFQKEDIEKIKDANLDFILLFSGFENIKGEILEAPRFGLWSYYHGDIKKMRGTPNCFWEIYFNENVTGSVLYRLTDNSDEIIILNEGFFKTKKISYSKNINHVFSESAGFVNEAYQRIETDKAEQIFNAPLKIESPVFEYPDNLKWIKFFLKMITHRLIELFHNVFFSEKWNIGLINSSIDEFLEKNQECSVNWLSSPAKKESFADPFIIKLKDKTYILYEDLYLPKNKANVSAAIIDNGSLRLIRKNIIEKAHHISFPFIFEYKNEIYLLLEEWRTNQLSLYKAKKFPNIWEKLSILLTDVAAIDPVIFQQDNFWWLFFTRRDSDPNYRLYIYYSENLFGPWKPHKRNPVKTDVRSSRPAGNLFYYNGNLIRPAQDCSETYGGRIALNKVIALNPYEFKEEPLFFIRPKRNEHFNKGIHTINAADNIIVIDGKKNIFTTLKISKLLKRRSAYSLYNFIDIPRPLEKSYYYRAIEEIKENLRTQNEVISIYQVGSFNHPGISDIDFLVIFKDNSHVNFKHINYLKSKYRYIFTHNFIGIPESACSKYKKYILWHNLRLLYGESLLSNKQGIDSSELEKLKTQSALEYLIENYIDLTIQMKYHVIKLRGFLQHLKAIKYDLEFLNVTSGDLYEMIEHLRYWLNHWFENAPKIHELSLWIDRFYVELKNFIGCQLAEKEFYVPEGKIIKLAENITLKYGEYIDYEFSGYTMPRALVGLNRKAFNLNLRFNSFIFQLPFGTIARHIILHQRYLIYKELKHYALKYHPHFGPAVKGIIGNI